jgi:hypothetical protein
MHSDDDHRWPALTDVTATADSYYDEVAMLKLSFEFELCELCDGDFDAHTVFPDPLGHAHMLCSSEQYNDELSSDASRCPQPLFPRSGVMSAAPTTSSQIAMTIAAATGGEIVSYRRQLHAAPEASVAEGKRDEDGGAAGRQHADDLTRNDPKLVSLGKLDLRAESLAKRSPRRTV